MEQSPKSMEHFETKIDSRCDEDDDGMENKKRMKHDRKKRGGLKTMPFILGNFAITSVFLFVSNLVFFFFVFF